MISPHLTHGFKFYPSDAAQVEATIMAQAQALDPAGFYFLSF